MSVSQNRRVLRSRGTRLLALFVLVVAIAATSFTSSALATTGPYAVKWSQPGDLVNHTVYSPTVLPSGKMPVLIWGEGGCIANGLLYNGFLSEIASHGILVIASGGPYQVGVTTVSYMNRAVDWAKYQDALPGGRYQGHLDATHVAVAGHSCGGLEAYQLAASRPEVAAVGIMDSGQLSVNQAQLNAITAPTLYVLGGSGDIAYGNGVRDFNHLPATLPAFLASTPTGHFGTYWDQNGGQFARILTDWIQWRIAGNATAAQTFLGTTCVLCVTPGWTVSKRNIS
jgi:hypothetical protein